MSNKTSVSEFLLLQFSDIWEYQILHFTAFLLLYLGIVSGNLLIVCVVVLDHRLHSPMYFFLMNLAIQDIGYASVIIPKSMANSLLGTRHISYSGCVAQIFLFVFFIVSDFTILTVMAYDRYVAICNPLEYEMIMNRGVCIQIIVLVWISVSLYAVMHTTGTFASPFCSNTVNQFFCEIPQLLKLACSDLNLIEIGAIGFGVLIGLCYFVFIVVTYVFILIAVRRIRSVQSRKKALSTCLPHFIVVFIFVFSAALAYLRPSPDHPSNLDIAITFMYSVVPPLLNPVIYSMRNKEIQNAMRRLLGLSNLYK